MKPLVRILESGEFFGQVLRSSSVAGMLFSESKYAGDEKLPRHGHKQAFFSLLLKGSYSERYLNQGYLYTPFSVVFHPPDEEHSTEMAPCGAQVFNIEISDAWLERLRECARTPDTIAESQGGELSWLAARLYRERGANEIASSLAIEGLVLEMLAVAARYKDSAGKQPPSWMNRAVEYLRSEFHRNLSVGEVAAVAGVSPLQLSRAFRQHQRRTISDYVHRLRIQFASEILLDPDASLADVAIAAGFTDQSHFTRVFKQVTGLTPGSFQAEFTRDSSRKIQLSIWEQSRSRRTVN